MSSPSVAGVLAALHAIHDGATPADQRQAASRFCDEFRGRGFAALTDALDLAAPTRTDPARHFGLQTLIVLVDRHWNSFDDAQKQALMSTGLNLVRTGSTGAPNEPRFVREMIARLVVDMAARQWPQHWPTLHLDLFAAAAATAPARHLALLVFATLADLIVTPTAIGRTFLPERRRAEIRAGFETVLPDVNAFVIGALQDADRALVVAALRCVASIADWASPTALVSGRIMSALAALFATPAYFDLAADPLLRLSSRKAPSPAGDEFVAEIGTVWTATVQMASQLVRAAPFPDQRRLLKVAVDQIAALSKYHRAYLATSDAIRNLFLSLLGDLLKIDSAEIGNVVVSIWIALVKAGAAPAASPTASTTPVLPLDTRPAILQELFVIAIGRFLASRAPISDAPEDGDDDDAAEQGRQYQKYRGAVLDLVRAIAAEAPLVALQLTAPHILRLLASTPDDHLNVQGGATGQTSTIQQLQAACVLLNAILDTTPFRSASDADLIGAQQALLGAVLQAAPRDPHVLARQAHLLQLFHDLLGRTPPALRAVVDKLLWMNGLAASGVADTDALLHQRRALSALIVIARKPLCAAQLLQWFADLSPTVLALCQTRPAHAPALLELLVTICNALPSAADRIQYALRLIGTELNEFVALDAGRFLTMFGLSWADAAPVLNVDEAVAQRDDRHRLLRVLNKIQFVLRSVSIDDARSQQVLYQALSGLCCTACALLGALHALYSPARTASASALVRAVFDPWTVQGDQLAASACAAHADLLESLRTQSYAIRDQCYLLLQSALACPYVFTPAGQHVVGLVSGTCLTDACLGLGPDAVHPSRRIPILTKVWAPFLDKCPAQHPMFLAVFGRLIRVQAGPLAQQWAAVMGGAEAGGGIEREVFEENALREYTRSLMATVQSAVAPHNWVAFTEAQPADVARDSACRAVCDDAALVGATFGLLQLGLQVPDSVTQARAAALVSRLLPMLTSPSHARDLFVPVMRICVGLLAAMTKSAATSSSTGQALLGLTFEVLKQFAAVDRSPFEVLLQHPGVVAEEVDALREALAAAVQPTKAMRAATRSFIFAYITERQASAPVRDLPSRLVLPDKSVATAESAPASPLPDLFA